MKKWLFLILVTLSFRGYAQLSSIEQTKVDELFKVWNSDSSPGVALGIVTNGKLAYTKGYGMADLEHNVPITDSTIFYIGSVSKQFVTMCLLLLEEQGKIGLDDRVQKYFPDFPDYGATLTIRNFVHHTSGVRDNLTLWELAGNSYLDHIDKEEMYQMIRRQKELNFKPGEKYLYSNSCYFMLGLIIEQVSGLSLNEFAQKNIFEPLGMRSTFFLDDNTRIIKNRAFSYLQEDGRLKNQIMRFDLVGSGGVYSNIKDLYLWDQNFYHNKLGKGSQTLIDKMHEEGKLNNGERIDYAFAIVNGTYRGLRTVSHSGSLASYRSYLLRFPDQQTSFILLGNVTPISMGELPYRVADVVLDKQLAPSSADHKTNSLTTNAEAEQKEFPLVDEKQYVGTFYSDELAVTYTITAKNNKLYCGIKSKPPVALRSLSQDLFARTDGIQLKFERNSKKQITSFRVNAGRVTNLKFSRSSTR